MPANAAALLTFLVLSAGVPGAPIQRSAPPARVSETALSVFESPAPDRCTWLRIDPVQGRREVIAELDRACTGVSVAWSPDGREALLDFPGEWNEAGLRHHTYHVSLDTEPARVTALVLPRAGLLEMLAFDTEGRPVALFLGDRPASTRLDETLTFDGARYPVPDLPGVPYLAHAFRRERGEWIRAETVATTSEACGAPGTLALSASRRLATNSAQLLDPAFGHRLSDDPIDPELFDRLAPYERTDAESVYAWVRLATERATVIAVEGSYEYPFLTTPVLVAGEDGIRELVGIAENAILAAESRGRYLLLSEAVSGARPALYDLEGGRRLFASSSATTATFWPR